MKPNFYLKNATSDKPTSIVLSIKHNKKTLKKAIGYTILPILWSKENQRPVTKLSTINKITKNNTDIVELQNINTKINQLESQVNKYHQKCMLDDIEFTFENLKKELNKNSNEISFVKEKKQLTLLEYIDKFISDIEKGKRLIDTGKNKGKKYAPGSIQTYRVFRNAFHIFCKNKKYDWTDIDMNFYTNYINHFNSLDYRINSVGKQIKHIKKIMRCAFDEGVHSNNIFLNKAFAVLETETDAVALSQEQLNKLYNIDLSKKPNYDLARDIFLCQSYTALRFSDCISLNDKLIQEYKDPNGKTSKFITIYTKKTNTKVILPIHSIVTEILKKYNGELPKIKEQKVNAYIKIVAEMAEINELFAVSEIIGGETINTHKPTYSMITTHTARRTAATLLFKNGVPSLDIMKISGHSTESNFLKYIRVSKEETAFRLAQNPFFNS